MNEIEAPPGEALTIDQMLSASTNLALTFGKLEGHIKSFVDFVERIPSTFTTEGDSEQDADQIQSEVAQKVAEFKAETDSITIEMERFRKTAKELGASECARIRGFEIVGAGS